MSEVAYGHLIVTRKPLEGVVLRRRGAEPIIVTLTELGPSKARLSFRAPLDIEIVREELLNKEGGTPN
jgi:sRNA-binding carbon storage regulator CsrA